MIGLLDTHTLIWYALDDPRLSEAARSMIRDPANAFRISPASIWEIAIKFSLGKLNLGQSYEDFLAVCLGPNGFALLAIDPAHLIRLASLPFPGGHKDPFDRLLIAQAMVENLPIVGADTVFDAYPVRRIW